jgi:phenylacetate-coenzyme A ligase PaaK-like adenylate-forming protein
VDECGCAFDDLQAFELEGRVQEVLFTTAGAPVTTRRVDQLFEGQRWIDFYQLVQRDRDRLELLAVARPGVEGTDDEASFRERAAALFGADSQLSIRYVRELPVNPSLKYPPTVNRTTLAWRPNG